MEFGDGEESQPMAKMSAPRYFDLKNRNQSINIAIIDT